LTGSIDSTRRRGQLFNKIDSTRQQVQLPKQITCVLKFKQQEGEYLVWKQAGGKK